VVPIVERYDSLVYGRGLSHILPKTEPAPLPIKDFDLIAPLVDETIEIPAEGIELQRRFDKHRQGIDTGAKVDGVTAQIYGELRACRRRH
jgi:hypothetical protein